MIVDRLIIRHEEDFYNRTADAVEIAFYEGKGTCCLFDLSTNERLFFTNNFELDGRKFNQPNVHLFSFNNPLGACKKCEGFGDIIGIDPDLVIPDTSKSVFNYAIAHGKVQR